jgi:hypothetical protein
MSELSLDLPDKTVALPLAQDLRWLVDVRLSCSIARKAIERFAQLTRDANEADRQSLYVRRRTVTFVLR